MKQLIHVLLVASLMACTVGQKTSHRSQPSWLYGAESNYVISNGVASTHEEAKQVALSRVKEEIIKSVAVQVSVKESLTTREEVSTFIESFDAQTEIKSDYFEAMKGITALKIQDFYWETIKQNGQSRIRYHIRYPFSTQELQSLIQDYESIQAEWDAMLNKVRRKEVYHTVESLMADIDYCMYLYRKIQGSKRQEALKLHRFLESRASDIQIDLLENRPGRIRYRLSLGGNVINTAINPDVVSNCDLQIQEIKVFADQVLILYTTPLQCRTNVEKRIEINYNLYGYRKFLNVKVQD